MHRKDEIDFIEVLKSPLRLFGMSYFYFLTVGIFIGAYYVLSFNTITRNDVAPIILTDSAQFIKDIPMKRGALIAPVNVTEIAVPSKELIAQGETLFKSNCASCHGDNGMGDGVSAAALKVKPRNFHSAEGWKFGRKISQIYTTLQNGIPASGMPAFNYTPAADRFAIIHYIRTFASDFPKDSLSDLIDLEKRYNLSKGTQLPAQIPVAMAMQKMENEYQDQVKDVTAQCTSMTDDNAAGAKIAMDVIRDEHMAVTAASKIVSEKSLDDFIKTVSSDPITIGFKADVLRLNSDEWGELYNYFIKLSRSKQS
jgi:mono/diheme cytochrome c family protein